MANFIDLWVVSRGLAGDVADQTELDEVVKPLLPRLRLAVTKTDVARVLGNAARAWFQGFDRVRTVRYRGNTNRAFVVYFLARVTYWLDQQIGPGSERLDSLLLQQGNGRPYEVEHLFTNRAGVYSNAKLSESQVKELRARIGALLLLDGSENASLGGLLAKDKVGIYPRYNWLAASLSPVVYKPKGAVKFRQFLENSDLKDLFSPYDEHQPMNEFIEGRTRLYEAIARKIWEPKELGLIVDSASTPSEPADAGSQGRLRLSHLLDAGFMKPGALLEGKRKGVEYHATLEPGGQIKTEFGAYNSPSTAAAMATDAKAGNGWTFWHLAETNDSLSVIRAKFLKSPHGKMWN